MMKKIAIATERPEIHRLVSAAIKDANSPSVSGIERCSDILLHLKNLRLTVKDLRNSNAILPLEILRKHKSPKIRSEVHALFNTWMKTLYSSGRSIPLNPKKPAHVEKVCSELKKKQISKKPGCKSFAAKPLSENPRCVVAHEAGEIKKILTKPDVCKLPSTSRLLHMKKQPPLKVSKNPNPCPALKKNSAEMLELFDMAKKSADVANAKGLLMAKAETTICVDTLSLLIGFPISSTAPETRRIMERLVLLTRHKDRKICNSALKLLHHWRQSIRDQQQGQDSRKTQV
ncbi:hypothetical protein AALP_AA6G066200 [Arabis alpina]|uniref:TFIIS N-terminal domain-containing protein n=1 Tax=Arabis alpina TaxID=50452 RepID=A0A087GMI3_ARAAL|nr:hypothetical protein AALP_AA6G066200 [Arabis alpina]